MNEPNWRKATLVQLNEIAYNDIGAPRAFKLAAHSEIKRREPRHSGKPDKHAGSKR